MNKLDLSILHWVKFTGKIHNYEITLNEAINDQTELKISINKPNGYNPKKKPDKITEKNKVLKSAKKLSDARHKIINFYEGFFLYNDKIFKKKKKNQKKKKN